MSSSSCATESLGSFGRSGDPLFASLLGTATTSALKTFCIFALLQEQTATWTLWMLFSHANEWLLPCPQGIAFDVNFMQVLSENILSLSTQHINSNYAIQEWLKSSPAQWLSLPHSLHREVSDTKYPKTQALAAVWLLQQPYIHIPTNAPEAEAPNQSNSESYLIPHHCIKSWQFNHFDPRCWWQFLQKRSPCFHRPWPKGLTNMFVRIHRRDAQGQFAWTRHSIKCSSILLQTIPLPCFKSSSGGQLLTNGPSPNSKHLLPYSELAPQRKAV